MKKLAISFLILTMTTTFISCGKDNKDKPTENNNNISQEQNNVSEKDNDSENKDNPSQPNNDSENKNSAPEENKESSTESTEATEPTDSNVDLTNNNNPQTNEDSTEMRQCRLFFYNGVEDAIYYKDSSIEVVDNALTKALTDALKSSPNASILPLPNTIGVTSAKINGDSITVDIGIEYYDFVKQLGSSAESGILKSIALTYSYNFNVSNVRILIGGKNYLSGHIAYGDGDYIDISNIKPIAL